MVARGSVGSNYIHNGGFMEVAELNNIIVLFPQAKETKENRYGCWDYFGFTGEHYGEPKL